MWFGLLGHALPGSRRPDWTSRSGRNGGAVRRALCIPPSDEHLRSHEAAGLPDPGPVKQRMGLNN